jgi:hypothetical protein
MLKDALNPTNLIIALTANVFFILLSWYLLVLQPALNASNPMDIKLTKKSSPKIPLPQALKPDTKVETPLIEANREPANKTIELANLAPANETLEILEKPDAIVSKHIPRRNDSARRKTSRKSANAVKPKKEIQPADQNQYSPPVETKYEEIKIAERVAEEPSAVESNEQAAQKIKSFGAKWRESFMTHATQAICTQVQIAMNQCPN